MSILAKSNPNPSALSGIFDRVSDCIEKTIYNRHVDYIENNLVALGGYLLPYLSAKMREVAANFIFSKNLSTKPISLMFVLGVSSVSMAMSMLAYQKYVLKPLIAKKAGSIIKQSVSSNLSKKALILNALNDWSGALSTRYFVSKLRNLAKTHSIQQISLSTNQQSKEALRSIHHKVDMVWIRAHGSSEKISFSDQLDFTVNSQIMMKQIGNLLKDGGPLILESCNNGKGSSNIAKVFSENCPHATVYASSDLVNGIDGLEFEDGSTSKPVFHVGDSLRKNTTRVYRAGKLLE